MKRKYILVGAAFFVLAACGAKTGQGRLQQSATTPAEMPHDSLRTALQASQTPDGDTLPGHIDSYTKADSALVCRILQEIVPQRQQLSNEQLVLKIARKFIGVPYVAHTLDRNEEEKLVVNLHGLDCSTYVETVTALTLCAKRGEMRFSDYVRQLEQIRYRDGKMGYLNRLHYFHWWLEDNERMGFVSEIDSPDPPFTAVQTLKINYMSLNTGLYDMLKNNPGRVAGLKKLEDATNGTRLRYIPKQLLNDSRLLREVIHDGDIVAIVTGKRELDTTHLGFAVCIKMGFTS